jgi:AraC-like DNA-binding protein
LAFIENTLEKSPPARKQEKSDFIRTKMTSWMQKIHPELNHLWRGEWGAGRLEPARYLYDHELVLVQRGSCTVEVAGKDFELATGSWIVIPPATNHSTVAGPEGVFRSCIHFNWIPRNTPRPTALWLFHPKRPKARQITMAPGFVPKRLLHGKYVLAGAIPGLVETIFYRWRMADDLSKRLAWIQFLEVLAHLFMGNPQPTPKRRSFVGTAYAAREILAADLSSRMGIQEQPETLGFSYAHVCRLFHRAFGSTPNEYRNALRLDHAKALLRDPRRTIAEVAYESGFSDPTYFARLFRRHNGIPPSQFR